MSEIVLPSLLKVICSVVPIPFARNYDRPISEWVSILVCFYIHEYICIYIPPNQLINYHYVMLTRSIYPYRLVLLSPLPYYLRHGLESQHWTFFLYKLTNNIFNRVIMLVSCEIENVYKWQVERLE